MASSRGSRNVGHNSLSLQFCPWLQHFISSTNSTSIWWIAQEASHSFFAFWKILKSMAVYSHLRTGQESLKEAGQRHSASTWRARRLSPFFVPCFDDIWWYLFTPETGCNDIFGSSLVAHSALFCQVCMFWNYLTCIILVRLKKTS